MAIIQGNENDNRLSGTADADTMKGFGGNDTLEGSAGADIMQGDTGLDQVSYRNSATFVAVDLAGGQGANGDAAGDTYDSIEDIEGSRFDDILLGNDEANFIFGGIGLQTGRDLIAGGGGDDFIQANGNISGGAGNDEIRTGILGSEVSGGVGNDTIRSGDGEDTIDGGADFDEVNYDGSIGGVSVSLLTGRGFGGTASGDSYTGIERVVGSLRADTISGDNLNNDLVGSSGDDVMSGNGGKDRLDGGADNDALHGGEGDDLLIGGQGGDFLNGDSDIDTVSYSASSTAVVVNLALNLGFNGDAAGDRFVAIENVNGSGFGDFITGSILANTLSGGLGDDTLVGGDGRDLLIGGSGLDDMRGGSGNDTYSVGDSGDIVDEVVGSGIDTVEARVSFRLGNIDTTRGNVENLTLTGTADINGLGNTLNNVITGNSGDNAISGGLGADTMRGGEGNDRYSIDNASDIVDETTPGAGGIDEVRSGVSVNLSGPNVRGAIENIVLFTSQSQINATGNALDNIIRGGFGINDLAGLGGNDRLTGSQGRDAFVFSAALNAATNVDTITDFSVADDTIRLENAFMTALSTGQLGAGAFHIGATAADASDRIVYNSASGVLSYDADGSGAGAAVRFATLDTGLSLTNADFFIV